GWHGVPVGGRPGAGDVGRARESDPLAVWELFEPLLPLRAANHLLDAGSESHRADAQPVGGERVRRHEMLETQLRRIYAELLGDLVEVDLEREARLRRPVAPFRSTRRLVRKSSCAL